MLVTILQITVPIKFSHTISTNAAQMIKSRLEINVPVFESLKPIGRQIHEKCSPSSNRWPFVHLPLQ